MESLVFGTMAQQHRNIHWRWSIGIGGLNWQRKHRFREPGTGNVGLFNSGTGNVSRGTRYCEPLGFGNAGNVNTGFGTAAAQTLAFANAGAGNTGFFDAGNYNFGSSIAGNINLSFEFR